MSGGGSFAGVDFGSGSGTFGFFSLKSAKATRLREGFLAGRLGSDDLVEDKDVRKAGFIGFRTGLSVGFRGFGGFADLTIGLVRFDALVDVAFVGFDDLFEFDLVRLDGLVIFCRSSDECRLCNREAVELERVRRVGFTETFFVLTCGGLRADSTDGDLLSEAAIRRLLLTGVDGRARRCRHLAGKPVAKARSA